MRCARLNIWLVAPLAFILTGTGNAYLPAEASANSGSTSISATLPDTSGWVNSTSSAPPVPTRFKDPNWNVFLGPYGKALGIPTPDAGTHFRWSAPPILLSTDELAGLVTEEDMGFGTTDIAIVAFGANGKPTWRYPTPSPTFPPVWTGSDIAFVSSIVASTAPAGTKAAPYLVLLSPSGQLAGQYPLASMIPSTDTIQSIEATPGGLLVALASESGPATASLLDVSWTGVKDWMTPAWPAHYGFQYNLGTPAIAVAGTTIVAETVQASPTGGEALDSLHGIGAITGKILWTSTLKRLQAALLDGVAGHVTLWTLRTPSGTFMKAVALINGATAWQVPVPRGVSLLEGPAQWLDCGSKTCSLRSTANGDVEVANVLPPKQTGLGAPVAMSVHYLMLSTGQTTAVVGINGKKYLKEYSLATAGPRTYNRPTGSWTLNGQEEWSNETSWYWTP